VPTGCAPSARRRPAFESSIVNRRRRAPAALAVLTTLAVLAVLGWASSAGQSLRTDLARAVVPLDEIVSGGPAPDGIPAIDRPVFVAPDAAGLWLREKEPVLAVDVNGDARAYPLQILMWHEIVNDTVGGLAVVATYCPLCNSGLVFERRVDGSLLDFGTSGKLYKSDLVMYDRQSHSLWAQMEGRAIVGARVGARLKQVPTNTLAFGDWRVAHPGGKVLSRETGHPRSYGVNPYGAYDQPTSSPFLFNGRPDPRRPPKERVVGIRIGQASRAYPWPVLARERVVHDTLVGERIVVFYQPGALSPLDESQMERSRPIGATAVFAVTDGKALSFEPVADGFRDRETATRWNLLGRALQGPLVGPRLRPIPHVDAFWFAWAAFNPSTSIHDGR